MTGCYPESKRGSNDNLSHGCGSPEMTGKAQAGPRIGPLFHRFGEGRKFRDDRPSTRGASARLLPEAKLLLFQVVLHRGALAARDPGPPPAGSRRCSSRCCSDESCYGRAITMSISSMSMASIIWWPQAGQRSISRAVRCWTSQGRGVDLRRSTVDPVFACFNSMAGRSCPPTLARFQKSDQSFLSRNSQHTTNVNGPLSRERL